MAHAERLRLLRHQLGEIVLVAGDRLRDHDGRVIGGSGDDSLDGIFDLDGAAGAQSELGRRLRGGVLGYFEVAVELELARFELLEQHVERHDLGERSRMPARVRIGRMQHGAGIAIDHDRCVRRGIGWKT